MRVLITGGTRGIGRATALACAEQGWRSVLGYRGDTAAAEATLAAVRAAGGEASVHAADISDAAKVVALFDAAEAEMGGLDAVVINAGIVDQVMPLAEMTVERLERMVQVNLTGALYCAREAARRLGEGGNIVFVSSIAARLGSAGKYVDYAATKGAIDTLTIGLAAELAPRGIRVNGVRPGVIDTDIHADGGEPDRVASIGPMLPMGRVGRPEEVAAAIVWLMSDAASYASGAIVDVAGGR